MAMRDKYAIRQDLCGKFMEEGNKRRGERRDRPICLFREMAEKRGEVGAACLLEGPLQLPTEPGYCLPGLPGSQGVGPGLHLSGC